MSNEIPDIFICPISKQMMRDPVVDSDGNTFEREEIIKWLVDHNQTSPITRHVLDPFKLPPNRLIKTAIETFRKEHFPETNHSHSSELSESKFGIEGESKEINSDQFIEFHTEAEILRDPLILFAVIDTSRPKQEPCGKDNDPYSALNHAKNSFNNVLSKLTSHDCASVIKFNSVADEYIPLTKLTRKNRQIIIEKMKHLAAENQSFTGKNLNEGCSIHQDLLKNTIHIITSSNSDNYSIFIKNLLENFTKVEREADRVWIVDGVRLVLHYEIGRLSEGSQTVVLWRKNLNTLMNDLLDGMLHMRAANSVVPEPNVHSSLKEEISFCQFKELLQLYASIKDVKRMLQNIRNEGGPNFKLDPTLNRLFYDAFMLIDGLQNSGVTDFNLEEDRIFVIHETQNRIDVFLSTRDLVCSGANQNGQWLRQLSRIFALFAEYGGSFTQFLLQLRILLDQEKFAEAHQFCKDQIGCYRDPVIVFPVNELFCSSQDLPLPNHVDNSEFSYRQFTQNDFGRIVKELSYSNLLAKSSSYFPYIIGFGYHYYAMKNLYVAPRQSRTNLIDFLANCNEDSICHFFCDTLLCLSMLQANGFCIDPMQLSSIFQLQTLSGRIKVVFPNYIHVYPRNIPSESIHNLPQLGLEVLRNILGHLIQAMDEKRLIFSALNEFYDQWTSQSQYPALEQLLSLCKILTSASDVTLIPPELSSSNRLKHYFILTKLEDLDRNEQGGPFYAHLESKDISLNCKEDIHGPHPQNNEIFSLYLNSPDALKKYFEVFLPAVDRMHGSLICHGNLYELQMNTIERVNGSYRMRIHSLRSAEIYPEYNKDSAKADFESINQMIDDMISHIKGFICNTNIVEKLEELYQMVYQVLEGDAFPPSIEEEQTFIKKLIVKVENWPDGKKF